VQQGGEVLGERGAADGPRGRSAIYSVELEVFEGPLDLLLHLVRRHELDILAIPIAFVTEKYLEYLDFMRSLDLEIAGDYLVMAATLAWLESRELLPPEPRAGEEAGAEEEDGEDPREALIRRLVEYERFKNAAAELDAMPVSGRDVFARGADIEVPPQDPGLAPVTLFRLAEAYYRVLTRAKIHKSHEVTIEPVTVAQRMQQLTLMLDERPSFEFEGLFLGRTWSSERELRAMLVVTLMSVLELVKLGVARVHQVPDSESIRIFRHEPSAEARALIEHYDELESFGGPAAPPPGPTEAELDEAEEQALLAEALAGADDADLGPDAVAATAANTPDSERPARDEATHEDATGRDPEASASDATGHAESIEPEASASDPGEQAVPEDMSDATGRDRSIERVDDDERAPIDVAEASVSDARDEAVDAEEVASSATRPGEVDEDGQDGEDPAS
jgi:segregation and condensation protein A